MLQNNPKIKYRQQILKRFARFWKYLFTSTFIFIFQESKRKRRSKGTDIESCYLLPVGKTSWSSSTNKDSNLSKEDKATTMDLEMQPKVAKMSPKESQHSSATSGGTTAASHQGDLR